MDRANPTMRELAKRLIAHETRAPSSGTKSPAGFLIVEKLRPQLATLTGSAGFRALLSRALSLTNAQGDWLITVRVHTDGTLDGLDELEMHSQPGEIAEGIVELLTQLLGLLEVFIGEVLTVRLVHEIWPRVSVEDLNSSGGGKK